MVEKKRVCPECRVEVVGRRDFMKTAAGAAVAASLANVSVLRAATGDETPEQLVKALYKSLTDAQKKEVALPFNDQRRINVKNNWTVVKPTVTKFFTADQQQLIKDIAKGLASEEGHEKFLKVIKVDTGGLSKMACAVFGNPAEGPYAWALTGRHLTLRCDANSDENLLFGGPIFYGHAGDAKDNFNESAGHPGNVFWYQAQAANKLFDALDPRQREKALLEKTPAENMKTISIRGGKGSCAGIAAGELSADQKKLVAQVTRDILSPFRPSDVERAMKSIQEAGGLDTLHLSFYKDEDLGSDSIWDNWMVQSPTISWFYRGAPHVHVWVNAATKA